MKVIKYIILQVALISSFALMHSCEEGPLPPPVPPSFEELAPEAIDLGLPSGVKWASFNVGAQSPEEHGGYFGWGETETKFYYDKKEYKWCNGDWWQMTKYHPFLDNKDVLDLEDDAAHVHWGGDWRMPTRQEMDDLISKCDWKSTPCGGYVVRGRGSYASNSIFLPGAGFGDESSRNTGYGVYWLSTPSFVDVYYYAQCLNFDMDMYCTSGSDRYNGRSVRPVQGFTK